MRGWAGINEVGIEGERVLGARNAQEDAETFALFLQFSNSTCLECILGDAALWCAAAVQRNRSLSSSTDTMIQCACATGKRYPASGLVL